MVIVLLVSSCGATYDDPSKCNVFDSNNDRLAACMANTPPYYCGGDSGSAGGGTTLHGEAHYTRYGNKSDHICSKAELDAAKIAPEVRPASQR